ncbi:MAG: DUF3383 family protein [Acidobacteriota bacterium]
MPNASLSPASLISVTASVAAAPTQAQNTRSLLILVDEPTIDVVTRLQSFNSASAVELQCGTGSVAAAAVAPWFDQTPQPTSILLGRWAQAASSGQLFGAPLTAAQQTIATWTAITDGGFTITIDGGAAQNLTTLNFANAANMNGVAAVIGAVLTGAKITWDNINGRFVITSNTTGTTSTVSFASAPTGGGVTDISGMLAMTATSSGCYQAAGIAAETASSVVSLFDTNYGQQWYGLGMPTAADADCQAVANVLAGSANKHFFWLPTQEAGVLVSATDTDLASLMKTANVSNTAVQYNGASAYAVFSLAGLMQTVNYGGKNTIRAAMYGQEPGITPDNLNATQMAAVIAKNANAFVGYTNGSAIIQPGICSNGMWIDVAIGKDALTLDLIADLFNLFLTTHVPQDDSGNHMMKVVMEKRLKAYRDNGFIAPGVWNGPLFGALQNNPDGSPPTLSAGYYVYAPPIASQSGTNRNARISVPFQIAVNMAGAVQTVNVALTLN